MKAELRLSRPSIEHKVLSLPRPSIEFITFPCRADTLRDMHGCGLSLPQYWVFKKNAGLIITRTFNIKSIMIDYFLIYLLFGFSKFCESSVIDPELIAVQELHTHTHTYNHTASSGDLD